jgi:DNA-binding NtrC family response regulator
MVKILCVDDEPFILNSIERVFSDDYEVFKATSANDALALIRRNDFDVVISDQRMPGITGTQLLDQIRNLSPRSIRILLTGYADLGAVIAAVNDGEVFRYITKPWNNAELRRVVAAGVRASRVAGAEAINGEPSRGEAYAPVLFLDTDDALASVCADVVADRGEVMLARSVRQAISHVNAQPELGVVVTALRVGTEKTDLFIKALKNFHPSVVTMIASDYRDADTIIRLINEGQIFRCMLKPVAPERMARAMQNAQARHRVLATAVGLQARFQVEETMEIAAAKRVDATEPRLSWMERFTRLFTRR